MQIKDNVLISAIQKEFNKMFPFLKIEFYEKKHAEGEGSENKKKIDPGKTIGEVRSVDHSGELKILETQKVGEFEKQFAKDYGLSVQVFRKSGDIWLQTTSTDEWTLKEQNQKGEVSFNISNE